MKLHFQLHGQDHVRRNHVPDLSSGEADSFRVIPAQGACHVRIFLASILCPHSAVICGVWCLLKYSCRCLCEL